MKRFFLVLLLLCLCLSTCAADQINCFVPDQMSKTMNQILPLVIKALGETSTSRIQDMTDYLSLSYTETEGQYMYYNNQDWNVELAFYFPGTAGVNRESQTLNFSVSKSLSETQIQALLYSFVLTVCYDNPSMDQNALIKYMVEVNSENDVYETEAGTFSFVLSDEVYHYVMVKPEKKAVQPKKTAKPAATMLLSDRNVSIRLTDVKPLVSRSYPAALELHVELTNNTNKTLYVSVENAKVNGVQVKGIGIYNIQPKSTVNDEYIILKAETKSAEKALGSAREATMKVVAVDSSTNQTVAEKTVTLDLSGVERFTPYPSAASVTPTPKVTARPRTTVRPTTKPTARPRATAKPTPRPTPRPTAKPTATPRASAQITSLDFSERMWAEWEFKAGDKLSISFEMVNTGRKSVREFELYLYAVDSRGNRIYGANQIYYATTKKTVSVGKTAYSDKIVIPEESRIDKVYCGIKRVVLSDGTVEEVPDARVDYYYWTIQ